MTLVPGLALAVVVALVATLFGGAAPIVGGPVFAIAIGVALASTGRLPATILPGVRLASKTLLQWSIVLLGANLSVAELASGGARSLPVMLGTFAIVMTLAFVIGKVLGLDRDVRRLLGVGTAICGGSAIAAISGVIEADEADVAYALGSVFLFNVIAVIVFPVLGHAMHLSQQAFGLWAGTAVNDTSSVVATAFSYGPDAGNAGVIVKLTRTLLIVPVVLFYAAKRMRYLRAEGRTVNLRAAVPWFVLWFLLLAVVNSLGWIPAAAHVPLGHAALFAIVVALAGVGLSSDVRKMISAGARPLLLGALLWFAIAVSSLAIANYVLPIL